MDNVGTTFSSQNIDKANQSFIDRKNKNNLSLKFDVMPPSTYLTIVTLQKTENHTFYITCDKGVTFRNSSCSVKAQIEGFNKYLKISTILEAEKSFFSELNKVLCDYVNKLNSNLTTDYNPLLLEFLKLSHKTGEINDIETALKYLECFVNSSADLNNELNIIPDDTVYGVIRLILEYLVYTDDVKIVNLSKKILTELLHNKSLPEDTMPRIIDKINSIARNKNDSNINKNILIDLLHNFIITSDLNPSLLISSLDCLVQICLYDDGVDPFDFSTNNEECLHNKEHSQQEPLYLGQELNRHALNKLSYIMDKEPIPLNIKQTMLIRAKYIAEQYTSFYSSADKTTVSSRTHKKLIDFIEKTQINLAEIQTKQNNVVTNLTD